ncbi:CURVATURE THYLAKOID 1D, chloroplastic-like [Thalictrum thalictroides]|uniref:CURVATURE THYLAKOID 1D, chloroplastic-like n=1 Tax=Thalictrum thalictroides TaxID=46969 RepID=A0A7J6W797_THATH|nr:CURVATURE THYLAKOID 1D, chloroplastic-like [Thalictrum thalictroides]
MELCLITSQVPCRRFIFANTQIQSSRPFAAISFRKAGLLKLSTSLLRATTSEEGSTGINSQFDNTTGVVATMEEPSDEINESSYTASDAVPKEESPKEESSVGDLSQLSEFLDRVNLKLDIEDKYSVLVYGSGALVALWLASAVVGSIDSIPVFPKVLELVGLSYTVWFSSRYLIFKKNRDELSAKIEELKQQDVGFSLKQDPAMAPVWVDLPKLPLEFSIDKDTVNLARPELKKI